MLFRLFTNSYNTLIKRSLFCSLFSTLFIFILFFSLSDYSCGLIISLIGTQLTVYIGGFVFLNYRKISREKIPAKKTALFFKLYSAPVFTTIALLILYFLRLTKRI